MEQQCLGYLLLVIRYSILSAGGGGRISEVGIRNAEVGRKDIEFGIRNGSPRRTRPNRSRNKQNDGKLERGLRQAPPDLLGV